MFECLLEKIVQPVHASGNDTEILEGFTDLSNVVHSSIRLYKESIRRNWHSPSCCGLSSPEYLGLSILVENVKDVNLPVAFASCLTV